MTRLLFALSLLATACATVSTPPPKTVQAAQPERFACRYTARNWFSSTLTLATADGALPFATTDRVGRAEARVTVPYGEARQGFGLRLVEDRVTVFAHAVPERPFSVYAKKPLTFGSVLRFEAGARLEVLRAGKDGLLSDVEVPKAFRPASLVRAAVRCEDTQLLPISKRFAPSKKAEASPAGGGLVDVLSREPAEEDFEELSPPPVDGGSPAYAWVEDVDLPVAASPGGTAEGVLRFDAPKQQGVLASSPRIAHVLALEGAFAKIRYTSGHAIVEGWVPRTALTTTSVSNVFGLLGGLGVGSSGKTPPPERARCAAEVPLYVRLPAGVTRVGALGKGAAVEVLGRTADEVQLALPELQSVKLSPGSSWILRTADEARCLAGPASL